MTEHNIYVSVPKKSRSGTYALKQFGEIREVKIEVPASTISWREYLNKRVCLSWILSRYHRQKYR